MNTCENYGPRKWSRHHHPVNGETACKSHTGEYITTIIFGLIFLWIVNHLQQWHLPFLRDNFSVVLWAINLSILIKIGGSVVNLMAGLPVVRRLVMIVTESASFVVQIMLYYIYPFDFSHVHGLVWVDWFLPLMLILGMVVSAVKVVANLWKLIFGRD